jgi:hypothetical protein
VVWYYLMNARDGPMLVMPTCREFIGFPLKLDKTPD